jgi:hypothetical protein
LKRLLAFTYVLLLILQGTSAYALVSDGGPRGVNGDVTQQPDPKKLREITASISRSVENELISLNAIFPESVDGVKCSLYNLLGKLIEIHDTKSVGEGPYQFKFRTKGLPNGPYIIVLEARGQRIIQKVMVAR